MRGHPAREHALTGALIRLRLAFGALLLLAPAPVLSALCGQALDAFSLRVCRLLGLRQLAQGALTHSHPTRRAQLAGAAVDAAHAASMAVLGDLRPKRRRFALRNALAGGALALAGAVAALADPRPSPNGE